MGYLNVDTQSSKLYYIIKWPLKGCMSTAMVVACLESPDAPNCHSCEPRYAAGPAWRTDGKEKGRKFL